MTPSAGLHPEGYWPASDDPRWNQSVYFNFYDPATRTGGFIRVGILENLRETNTWFLFFRDGKPLFTRLNMNLPYTDQRLATGIDTAGMRLRAVEPLKKALIEFDEKDFAASLTWSEILPMQDAIHLTDLVDDAFSEHMSHVHMESVCSVSGHIRIRDEVIAIDGKGFRDVAVGPRNWDYLQHYRVAWPIFDDGSAIAVVHGTSTTGESAYIRMLNDGSGWIGVKDVVDRNFYDDDEQTLIAMEWSITDARDRIWKFTAKPIFRWFFPFDTFVLAEHMMEYTLEDGTKGYGLGECGYRSPWGGNGEH